MTTERPTPGTYMSMAARMQAYGYEREAAALRCAAEDVGKMQEMERVLSCIVLNAVLIPDPQMRGMTDAYAVPLDDITAAYALLGGTR
jgi:hypothetical protein